MMASITERFTKMSHGEAYAVIQDRLSANATTGEDVRYLLFCVAELGAALEPFAAMDRKDCDLDEVACERGCASDLILITSGDFRNARLALQWE